MFLHTRVFNAKLHSGDTCEGKKMLPHYIVHTPHWNPLPTTLTHRMHHPTHHKTCPSRSVPLNDLV